MEPSREERDRQALGPPIFPEPARAEDAPGARTLHEESVRSWREHGYALVDGVFPADLIERARAESAAPFPTPGSAAAEAVTDFGSLGLMEFPTRSRAVNEITLHPRLLDATSQLLGVPIRDLRLTQSEVWPKYGRTGKAGGNLDNYDQRIHIDYPNHSLTHPAAFETPESVALLVYFDDIEEVGGATQIVPRSGPGDPAYAGPLIRSPGIGGIDFVNDREGAEAALRESHPEIAVWREENLYARARSVRFRPGTTLFYRHDVWHRGTPIAAGALRIVQNISFKRADCEWISIVHRGWAWSLYDPSRHLVEMIAKSRVDQRCVLGFPAPGSAYWTRATLDAVAARFGREGMDLSPYEEALASKPSTATPALAQLHDENARLRSELHQLRASRGQPATD